MNKILFSITLSLLIFLSTMVTAPPVQSQIIVSSYLFTWTGITDPIRTDIVSLKGPQATIVNNQTNYSPITLEVKFGNRELFEWFDSARQGNIERRTVQLFYYDQGGRQIVRYDLREMWPYKYTLKENPETRLLTEEYEFAYENFTRN